MSRGAAAHRHRAVRFSKLHLPFDRARSALAPVSLASTRRPDRLASTCVGYDRVTALVGVSTACRPGAMCCRKATSRCCGPTWSRAKAGL